MKRSAFFLLFAAVVAVACGSSNPSFTGPTDGGTTDGSTFQNPDANGTPTPIGNLTGTVFAPEGTIPISGALLYLTGAPPGAIPGGVYCDKCVQLTASTPNTLSNADGTFTLPAYQAGKQYLVVQKGAFRRVRALDVPVGNFGIPKDMTTLPGKMDKANGDDIPKMAVVRGAWDAIEASLEKLGLGKPKANGVFDPATASFDVYENKFPPVANDPFLPSEILTKPSVINQYHIVFIPCSSSNGTDCTQDYMAGQANVKSTLQQFVAQGGKLYATDYSYEYVRQGFPGYVDWAGQTAQLGSACQTSEYSAPAIVGDKGLGDWMTAIGNPSFTLQANWTEIDKVNTLPGKDENGATVAITPKVWVSASLGSGPHPSTISFQQGCGRVLFSTYHTEAKDGTLLAQEKALLYVLLEVAVCIGSPMPN